MTQQLRALTALTEDLCSVLGTDIGQLKIANNPSSGV